MSVAYWAQDAVFYQIFPDRFANGDPSNDPPNLRPWNAPPTVKGFQGGDLRGIIQKFDYLLDLGINAIYLNPIFQGASTHRYDTTDYLKIDPKLGTLTDFKALLDVAHQNQVRVVLDGVFNHCGRGFQPFTDVLENQEDSPYKDWFHIHRYPLDAYTPGDAVNYLGWWKLKSLPKLNTDNPKVRQYLLYVARYWLEQGMDGWRLDVPNEINDPTFWAEFRDVVKTTQPDAYILGEIWEMQPEWVGPGRFDGLMNYPLRVAILNLLRGTSTAAAFMDSLDKMLQAYPRENMVAMYNPIGSHDTERILTLLGGDFAKVKLAMALQFAFPGAPAVYYGDEIGLAGGKDPDCRHTLPWEPAQWNHDLHAWVKKLIHLRHQWAALRRGSYLRLAVDGSRGCLAFARTLGDESVVVVVNSAATRHQVRLPVNQVGWQDGRIVHNLFEGGENIVSGEELIVNVPPSSALWLV